MVVRVVVKFWYTRAHALGGIAKLGTLAKVLEAFRGAVLCKRGATVVGIVCEGFLVQFVFFWLFFLWEIHTTLYPCELKQNVLP